MKLQIKNIGKDFAEKQIFDSINFNLKSGESAAIVGPNGSGKTTLVKIICGLIRASRGEVIYSIEDKQVPQHKIYHYVSLVGPYLEVYEELTAMENLMFFARIQRVSDAQNKIISLLAKVNLAGREDDEVRTYSSGMRQRLKYAFALLTDPQILILDEPTSNLDSEGIDRVYTIMSEQKKKLNF